MSEQGSTLYLLKYSINNQIIAFVSKYFLCEDVDDPEKDQDIVSTEVQVVEVCEWRYCFLLEESHQWLLLVTGFDLLTYDSLLQCS